MFHILLVCLLWLTLSHGYIELNKNMKSFSSAIKNGEIIARIETILFESMNGPACITEQWFTGEVFDENSIVRIYIDNDMNNMNVSISYRLLLGHGIGFNLKSENENVPWATKRIGHNARNGGLFNTYRIPYQSKIKITIETHKTGIYWYIIRGMTNLPVIIGDIQLPSNARLKLYKNENIKLGPLEFITLANASNTSGMLYMVTVEGISKDYNYLEACFRALIDGSKNFEFLSSGTEDFFLSAYYFNAGKYWDNNAGLTYFDGIGSMSYKFVYFCTIFEALTIQQISMYDTDKKTSMNASMFGALSCYVYVVQIIAVFLF